MKIKKFTKNIFKKRLKEIIKKINGKHVVYPKKGGKRLGTHDSYKSALRQLRAIERSKNESQDLIKGGLSDKLSLSNIAKKHNVTVKSLIDQLKMGIEIEFEHTNDIKVATEIAMDHLVEDPKYYTKLQKMEK